MKNNLICAGIFAVICAVCFVIWQYREGQKPAEKIARVMKNGELIEEIHLSNTDEPYEFTVSDNLGSNTIRAEHDRIAVTDADCPDKLCVKQGYIDNGVIVCLPHKLTVEIAGGEKEADAVAGGN